MTKVKFRFSRIFDEYNRQGWAAFHKSKAYPSSKKTEFALVSRSRIWKRYEKKIISELEKIVGLRFKESSIDCYVVGRGVPISDPLILPIFINHPSSRFIDTLSHELVHRLLSQPKGEKKLQSAAKALRKKYKKESWNILLHVVVNAVMAKLYVTVFSYTHVKSDYDFVASLPEYKRAWDIVLELKSETILALIK